MNLKCSDKLDALNISSGNRIIVNCPLTCKNDPTLVIGTNNSYSFESSVCKAAINSGYTPKYGKFLISVFLSPEKKNEFAGQNNNGVSSDPKI